ncbi:MAG TPA: hypothetical protein VGW35_12600 [Methylomirabilota bacterium]|nr:hypothetical protein [Methylomirabilota bacterium]
MLRFHCARLRVPLTLVFGGWLVFLVAETGPHLVHHVFDTDEQPACSFLAAADCPSAAGAVLDDVPAPTPSPEPADAAPAAPLLSTSVGPTSTRGPPRAPLALA